MAESKSKILEFINRGRKALMLVSSLSGAMLALAMILIASVVMILVNGVFYFETGARSGMFFAWLIIAVGGLIAFVFAPIFRAPKPRRIAVEIEKEYPQLETRLVSAFDLMAIDAEKLGYSSEIISAAVMDTGDKISGLNPGKIAPYRKLREKSAWLAFSLLLMVGVLAAFPATFQEGLKRSANPFRHIPRQSQTNLKVTPGDTQVTKYGNLEIEIEASGKIPETITVYRIFDHNSERGFKAVADEESERRWSFNFEDVKRDFSYYVIGGDYTSRVFDVQVVNRPRIVSLRLTLNYPGYTGLPSQAFDSNDGVVDAPYGTYVTVETKFSSEIESGELVFSDTTETPMKIDGERAEGTFRVTKPGFYSINVRDEEGLTNDDPIQYPIRVRMDEHPTVEITSPGVDVDLTDDMLVPLSILAEDDYGFSSFKLVYYIEKNSGDTLRTTIPFDTWGKPQVAVDYLWNLGDIGMVPNDIVLYWIEAFDNDRVTGPKMAKSRVYSVRFPSIDEIIRDVSEERNQQMNDVEEVARQERELQKELNELTREMMRETDVSYEQREDLREALQKQEELAQKLEQTAEEYDKTTEKVSEQQLASMEVIQKMMEVQQLLQEVATEEMRQAMKEMQEALESMDPEAIKKAAEEFQMTQEQLMENLDRTLSLLKRMQVEQRVEDMKALSEKLGEMQEKVSEALEDGSMSQEQMQEMQDRITEGSELLEEGLKELAKMMKEFPDMPSDKAQELSDQTQENSPSQKSGQCSSSMSSGNNSQCKSQSKELSEQFEQTAEQLAKLQQEMQDMLSQETMDAIRRAVFGLLDLSSRQEEILDQLAPNPRDREFVRSFIVRTSHINNGLTRITSEVISIAEKNIMISPAIGAMLGNGLKQMTSMLKELEQGRGYSASPAGYEAMASMNVAAEKLLETMDMMNSQSSSSCGGGQSFFQKMQGMCQKQGGINQATMPLAGQGMPGSQPGGQPGGMTPDQMAAAGRLAAEQEAVRKSMEELAGEAEQRSDIAGRMDDILGDMDEVIKDLRNRGADERTLQRQERILNRMLDIQKSLHKQEFEERRKSKTADEIVRPSPDQLPEDLGERRDVLQQQLLRALNQPYPKEYEELIKSYFNSLRESEISE